MLLLLEKGLLYLCDLLRLNLYGMLLIHTIVHGGSVEVFVVKSWQLFHWK